MSKQKRLHSLESVLLFVESQHLYTFSLLIKTKEREEHENHIKHFLPSIPFRFFTNVEHLHRLCNFFYRREIRNVFLSRLDLYSKKSVAKEMRYFCRKKCKPVSVFDLRFCRG